MDRTDKVDKVDNASAHNCCLVMPQRLDQLGVLAHLSKQARSEEIRLYLEKQKVAHRYQLMLSIAKRVDELGDADSADFRPCLQRLEQEIVRDWNKLDKRAAFLVRPCDFGSSKVLAARMMANGEETIAYFDGVDAETQARFYADWKNGSDTKPKKTKK